jgi:glutamate racemase
MSGDRAILNQAIQGDSVGIDMLAGLHAGPVVVRGRAPRLLVFDSGLGGLTVAAALREAVPGGELIYLADDAVFPYGALDDEVLVERVGQVVSAAVAQTAPDLVVVACNTASTLVLPMLRARLSIPVVGTVPAIKPAVEATRTGRIAVLATAGTIRRTYTSELVERFAGDCAVDLVAAPGLASLAERRLRGEAVPESAFAAEIAPCFRETGSRRTDVVVLACTHFPLVLPELKQAAPWPVTWIDPAPAIARRAASLLDSPVTEVRREAHDAAFFTSGRALPAILAAALHARGFAPASATLAP